LTSSRIHRSQEVLWRTVGPEVLLTSLESDGFEVLSETAADVWRLLESPRTTAEIAARLSVRFGEPVELVTTGVERLVRDLRAHGYVRSLDG
jgi:hypothetical protein